ncbi:MAG: tRNA pseudouridine(55) synthase TruB [Chlamydiae bacterium]|nr:tRNA pseudouridine(55) synthase TruB [Chlamydiota bacterium]MBI3277907.1 tRNA pseudouridine(55) synthase TruB [Chlamydiota bacterium]
MDGILVVDKPGGMTSHDVVLLVRRKFQEKKVGHTGILDPMATGVLILVLGKETKRANILIDQDKEYQGILRLGMETSTQDREGKVLSTRDPSGLKPDRVIEVLHSFKGEIEQIPPMVSSRRYQGQRLYELARKGIEVERLPKSVWIHDLKIDWIHLPFVSFRLTCSKGTYVRTLCHDVGNRLEVGGHLYALQRLKSGPFTMEQTVGWNELNQMSREDVRARLLNFDSMRKQGILSLGKRDIEENDFLDEPSWLR